MSMDLFDSVWPDFGNSALQLTSEDFDTQDMPHECSILNDIACPRGSKDRSSTKTPCDCRDQSLKCLNLLEGNDVASTRLDDIISKASDIFQHVRSFKSCNVCNRFTVQTTLAIYLLQHLADHFCNVARNPQAFFAGVPQLKLGSLSLPHELDTRHKIEIVLQTLDTFRQVAQAVVVMTESNPILEKSKMGEAATPPPTAMMNARFLIMSAQHLQKRVQLIVDVFQNATTTL